MDWIKYGKTGVWVSIGVILTGVTFWELTKDPYIDAQAVAEVSAALRERTVITALRFDETPQWGEDPGEYDEGRTIGPYISTRDIYDHVLTPARKLFVEWEPIWCLDTNAFEHGQVLVTTPYEYGPLTNYNEDGGSIRWERHLRRIPGTPAVDHVYTTATRWPWEKMNLEPGPYLYSLYPFQLYDLFLTNTPFAWAFGRDFEWGDLSVPSPEIQEKDGGPWYEAGLGTNAYRLDCEVGSLATNLTVIPFASSNNILQAAAMLEPLKRTIHVVDLSSCRGTQAIEYVGFGSTEESTDESSDVDTSLAGIRDFADLATLIARALGNATVTTNEFEFNGTNTMYGAGVSSWRSERSVTGSGSAEGSGGTVYYRPIGNYSEAWSENSLEESVDVGWTDRWLPDIRPPVPSAYACASGFVSRVQVFGVFVASANPFYLRSSQQEQQVVPPWTLESSSCTNGPHSPLGPGYEYISSHLSYPPPIRTGDRVEFSEQFQTAVSGGVTLSLLVDEANPKAPPEFSLGVQGGIRPSVGDAMSHTLQKKVDPPSEGNDAYREWTFTETTYASLDFGGQTRIDLITFIIVIDWNWEHLNRENPFVPEEHEPEWMKQPDE